MKKHIPLILALGLFTNQLIAEESYNAKSLFFGEDPSAVTNSPKTNNANAPTKNKLASTSAKKTIGASYFVKLKNADGTTSNVSASRVFKSGEQFQLGVKVKQPSYIYVYNKAPNGKTSLIYPSNNKKDNFINAMGTIFLPAQGSFAFDQEPGNEELMVYVSQKPMNKSIREVTKVKPDVYVSNDQVCLDDKAVVGASVDIPKDNDTHNMVAMNDVASKGIFLAEDKNAICKTTGGANDIASKGIFFAEDASQAESGGELQPAAYVVKAVDPKKSGSLLLKINLKHQ